VSKAKIVVVGLGEVGKPLFQILSQHIETVGVDIAAVENVGPVDILHVCYPFEIPDFVGVSARYIEKYKPALTIVNSTVSVGTTRAISERTGTPVVNSPVRGKHIRMQQEMLHYTKFIGAADLAAGQKAAEHFQAAGMKTKILASPEASELAKLTETTFFGLMIAWAQEVERYCDQTGADYNEVISFYEEIKFFPQVKYFPGVIGGHCVMPNIKILSKLDRSAILQAIESSNEMKIEREERAKLAQSTINEAKKVAV
jgi:UDP-N-acetyl-D-mannosaminuronate dehydrogenase